VTLQADSDAIQLVFIGDVSLGESPSSIGLGVSRVLGEPLYRQWGEYLSGLSGDFIIGNFEGTVSKHSTYARDHILHKSMRTDPDTAGPIGVSGISHFSLANNHSNDHGEQALQESKEYLDAQGIVGIDDFWTTGNVYEFCKSGMSIGVIAINFVNKSMGRTDEAIAPDLRNVPDLISRVAQQRKNYDHLIITVHWGDNYGLWPNGFQVEVARQLANAGAAAIIGHHPHNIQAIDDVGSAPVVYSLGSFCFENKTPFTRLGQIVVLQCSKETVEIAEHQHISIDSDYRVSEMLSTLQRLVTFLTRRKPVFVLNYLYVLVLRIWIFGASFFRVLLRGDFGLYIRWIRYRYSKSRP